MKIKANKKYPVSLKSGGNPTIRQELAARLLMYWRTYGRPESYSKSLGIGRIEKSRDRLFHGHSVITKRFHNPRRATKKTVDANQEMCLPR